MNTELEALRSRNPGVEILPAADPQFASYGRLLTGFDLSEIEAWGRTVAMPESGNAYQASDAVLEALPAAQAIGLAVYGGMPFQAGPCRGHNHVLNGIEYHSGSEVDVCLQPCVLILGHLWDMQGNTYDGAKTQAFYCEAGQVVQTYETTLHYTPCAVGDTFFTACFLPRGTGDALPNGPKGILKKRNKWFVAHPENTAKVAAGDYPGLLGAMREIK